MLNEIENKFQIGDVVVALPEANDRYDITNLKMIQASVIKVFPDSIRILILDHVEKRYVGHEYDVLSSYFRVVKEK